MATPAHNDTTNDNESDIQTLHKHLTTQATTLLSELTAYHSYLTAFLTTTTTTTPSSSSNPTPLITRPDTLLGKFQVDVRREVDHLLKYSDSTPVVDGDAGRDGVDLEKRGDDGAGKVGDVNGQVDLDGIHRIRSSNITFLADVWEGIKGATGVVGVRKGVRYYPVLCSGLGLGSGPRGGGGDSMTTNRDVTVAVQQRADGDCIVVGETGMGVKGVSKKMNREARERVKRERKMLSQGQDQGQDRIPSPGPGPSPSQPLPNTSTSTPTNIPENVDGNPPPKPSPTNPTQHPHPHPHLHLPLPTKTRGKLNTKTTPPRKDKETVTIDIISDHGATWTKIFTKNQRWFMLDLAKEGIVDDDNSDDENNDNNNRGSNGLTPTDTREDTDIEAMEELKLVKMAREFMAASGTSRVGRGHRHPRVQFHLSKISRGVSRDVDRVLGYMGRIGVEVFTAEEVRGLRRDGHDKKEGGEENGDMDDGMSGSERYERDLQRAFERMACPLPPVLITETLNVDCTILIALISDVSAFRQVDIEIPRHYKGTARRDIEVQLQTDVEDPLLPNHIYPILRGRRLVCTKKATEHWTNIVRIMGSPTEAERCRIFLGEATDGDSQGLSARQRLQRLSVHEVPEDLQLPFEIVDFDLDDMSAEAGDTNCKQVEIDVMRELAKEPRLSSLNSSVFFHGWYKGLTTISLNRVVSEWLNRAISVILDDLELRSGTTSDIAEVWGFSGANVLICGRERSLLGSEK